ncbi:phage tail protein [Paenibacillus dendritiformis]|uniref:phage tail-collar fiber domain-containing protein n=1 Tax=Paenibacillus dendritiformis TaxID=130049 RepID=UPI00197E4686|nr:phage tail protein [Paenibacillus dendritiformis]
MAAFGGMIITNRGRALQAKAQTGTQLKYTRIKVGDGKLGGQSIPTLNDLISAKKSLDIKKLEVRPGGKAVVGCMLSNAGLKSGFYFREIGVFAQDPDEGEILYSYGNSGENAEYIPPEGGPDVIEKYIDVVTIVQNAPNVSAVIDGSLVYPTNKEMEIAIKEYFEANNNAKIMPPKAFKAEDPGDEYPKGMSMFYLDADGMEGGWPVNHGQVITWVTARNRLSQFVFETTIATQRIWSRRWSSTQNAWSEFRELETTTGSAEKVAQALNEAKAYTDEKTSNIDAPVKSVNGKTGDVALTADDVGAVAKNGDSVIAGMLSMSKNDGPHLQLVGTTSAFGEWYVNNERKGWVGVGNRNEPSTVRLTSEVGPLVMQSVKDEVHIHGTKGVFLEGRRVVAELDLVKQSVVDGKGKVAGAINDMGGGPVSANNTFDELAAAIRANQGASGVTNLSAGFFDKFQGNAANNISGPFHFNKAGNAVGVTYAGTSSKYEVSILEINSSGTVVSQKLLERDVSLIGRLSSGIGVTKPGINAYVRRKTFSDIDTFCIFNSAGVLVLSVVSPSTSSISSITDITQVNGKYYIAAIEWISSDDMLRPVIYDSAFNKVFTSSRSVSRLATNITSVYFVDSQTLFCNVGGYIVRIYWNGSSWQEVVSPYVNSHNYQQLMAAYAYR